MKTKLTVILLAIFLIIPTVVLSAPTPASYDDPAWEALIEKGIGTALPASEPLGPGAVSGFNGESYWPRGFLQIHKPFDLKNHKGLIFSKPALEFGQHYASETVKIFLEATLEALGGLDPAHKPVIPIQALFYAPTDSVPMRNLNEDTLAVKLGVFILNNNESEPLPFAQIGENGIQRGTDRQLRVVKNAYERYHRYVEGMRPHLNMLKSLAPNDMQKKINELNKAIREEAKNDKPAKEDKPVKENKHKAAKNPQKDAKIAQIEARYQSKQDKIRAQLAETTGPERKKLAEQYVMLERELEKEIENIKLSADPALAEVIQEEHAFYDDIDAKIRTATLDALACETSCQKLFDRVNDLESERNQLQATRSAVLRERAKQPGTDRNRSARNIQFNEERRKAHAERIEFNRNAMRMTKAKKSAIENTLEDREETLDIPRTWALFEAMLTQPMVPVADIVMPITLKDDLITYAIKANRPDYIISQFEQVVITKADAKIIMSDGITVHLMCSVRDRLLGCQLGGDPEIEAKITDVISRMLELTQDADRHTQFRAIEYAVRANPVDLTFKLDTKKLKESIKSMLGQSRKTTYNSLLAKFNKIPLRGQAPKNSKASQMRQKSNTQDNDDLDL